MEPWQRKALDQLAKLFGMTVAEYEDDKTFQIGHVVLTPPDAPENTSGKWETGIVTVIPGVRYYPDGSGQPDDVDFSDDRELPSWDEAFRRVAELLALFAAESIAEGCSMEDVYKNEELH